MNAAARLYVLLFPDLISGRAAAFAAASCETLGRMS